jgi:lipoprotein-anchoring transpeptidase ErfK/SrfK
MKHLALSLALLGASTLGLAAGPVQAAEETVEAIQEATKAAEQAERDMLRTFGQDTIKNGQFLWKEGSGSASVTRVVISLSDQMAYAYDGEELVGVSTISSGRKGYLTPIGRFPILEKKRMHRSIKYENAPMPFMQRLDDYGIAMHAGALPGRPASHGCIRLPQQFASKLFGATRVGTEVLIGEPGENA